MSAAAAGWLRPVQAPLGAPFGQAGPLWSSGRHTGQDFECPAGTPVHAVTGGRILWAGNTLGPYGIQVRQHVGRGLQVYYCHLSQVKVSPGQLVSAGDVVGLSGATGNVTGPHLHLEVRKHGQPVDPMPYLTGAAQAGAPSPAPGWRDHPAEPVSLASDAGAGVLTVLAAGLGIGLVAVGLAVFAEVPRRAAELKDKAGKAITTAAEVAAL